MEQEHLVQITGKAHISHPLDNDTEYQFTGVITTYGTDSRSNQDGTHKYTYKGKFTGPVSLIKGDTVILGQKGKSQSQKLRGAVFARGHDYEQFMPFIFSKLDDLFNEYESQWV